MTRRRMFSSLTALALMVATCGLAVQFAGSASASTAPTFTTYAAPSSVGGTDAGEPSVGVNPKTGDVLYQAGLQTLRIQVANGTATWADVSAPLTSTISLDPILFTDQHTGRTFVSQLMGACSLMAYTDDDGGSWVQNPFGCGAGTAVDHQSVGGGVYAPPLSSVPNPVYADATYYCAQADAGATCARSDDGGLTFGPGVPMYSIAQCGGLHGHLKVSPVDGSAYVPNAYCYGSPISGGVNQGVAYSTNDGTTWNVSLVPDSSTQYESDPSVAVAKDGTVYFGYADDSTPPKGASQSQPRVAVAHKNADGSLTWSPSVTVDPNIKNTQFPTMVAGDGDRAAIAYLGTTTAGDDQSDTFAGVWHLFVSTTFDGGKTWTTTDVTGNDPVQRGCISLAGTVGGGCSHRNLLDFNDATLDATGHVVVAYADGCTSTCVNGGKNTYSSLASLAYQSGGDPLYASGTTTSSTAASSTTSSPSSTTSTTAAATLGAPALTGRTAPGNQTGVRLSWTTPSSPDPITGYEVLRSTSPGGETVLKSVSGTTTSYRDNTTTGGTTYYYEVRAVTAKGPGPASNEVAVTAA